ncbi:MAG: Hsp33 family molecular chaperone HslO [Spirochaetales bacterium]|nr:Hsp33 family molecular chaperone HslO [Spirochaetales bacterium]
MIQRPSMDPLLEAHLRAIAGDGTDIYLLADGTIRLIAVHGTTLVNRTAANHRLGPVGTLILGQAYVLALLSSSNLKNDERISLVVECDGPLRGLAAEANSRGQVRGYLRNNDLDLGGNMSIDELFGPGALSFIRVAGDGSRPFQGQTEWRPGDLTQNVAWYYADSEQTATLVDVHIHFDEMRVVGAAGLLVQALPGAEERTLEEIGRTLEPTRPLGTAFAAGATTAQLVQNYLARWNPQLVGTRDAEFYCGCSRERFGTFLSALPDDEREDILKNGPFPLKTTCHNCNTTYDFERSEIERLFVRGSSAEPRQTEPDGA